MDELEPTMARKAGRGEMDRDQDFPASRGGQRHGMAESRCERTCRLSTPHPLLDLLRVTFGLNVRLYLSREAMTKLLSSLGTKLRL